MKPYFELPIVVGADSIDGNNHVNNQIYLQWMNEVAIAHADSLGSSLDNCLACGGSWFAREHNMKYLAATFVDDKLTITTCVTELSKISCVRKYKVVRDSDQTLLFQGETFWVFVNAIKAKPMKIPLEIRRCFAPIIVDDMV